MNCQSCGRIAKDDDVFCTYCGTNMSSCVQQSPPTVPIFPEQEQNNTVPQASEPHASTPIYVPTIEPVEPVEKGYGYAFPLESGTPPEPTERKENLWLPIAVLIVIAIACIVGIAYTM